MVIRESLWNFGAVTHYIRLTTSQQTSASTHIFNRPLIDCTFAVLLSTPICKLGRSSKVSGHLSNTIGLFLILLFRLPEGSPKPHVDIHETEARLF